MMGPNGCARGALFVIACYVVVGVLVWLALR